MRGTRKIGSATLALGIAVTAAALVAPGIGAASAAGRTLTVQTIAPGVTLTRIGETAGPNHVYVLTIDPSKPSTLDDTMAGGGMGSYATPSQIGAAHSALAAINGDFSVDPGRPLHAFASNGTLIQSGLQAGAAFAMSQDETRASIDNRTVAITGRQLPGTRTFAVSGANGDDPSGGGIALYSTYGGWSVRPPSNACSVRLKTPGKFHWGPGRLGVVRDWVVGKSVCAANPLPVTPGTIVLSSNLSGAGSQTLRKMKLGNPVRLTWSFGWTSVMDSVGGMPVLVSGGKAQTDPSCNDYFCSRNPRTGIGLTADGHILLVVVDGRSNASVGMTLDGFAHYMISLGATSAINLDGGGGSAMWINGQGVVNSPSDYSGERPVTNAVLLLPGADTTEATPLPYSQAPSVGGPFSIGHGRIGARTQQLVDRRAMTASMSDPGSTGGLITAVASGAL